MIGDLAQFGDHGARLAGVHAGVDDDHDRRAARGLQQRADVARVGQVAGLVENADLVGQRVAQRIGRRTLAMPSARTSLDVTLSSGEVEISRSRRAMSPAVVTASLSSSSGTRVCVSPIRSISWLRLARPSTRRNACAAALLLTESIASSASRTVGASPALKPPCGSGSTVSSSSIGSGSSRLSVPASTSRSASQATPSLYRLADGNGLAVVDRDARAAADVFEHQAVRGSAILAAVGQEPVEQSREERHLSNFQSGCGSCVAVATGVGLAWGVGGGALAGTAVAGAASVGTAAGARVGVAGGSAARVGPAWARAAASGLARMRPRPRHIQRPARTPPAALGRSPLRSQLLPLVSASSPFACRRPPARSFSTKRNHEASRRPSRGASVKRKKRHTATKSVSRVSQNGDGFDLHQEARFGQALDHHQRAGRVRRLGEDFVARFADQRAIGPVGDVRVVLTRWRGVAP